MANQRCNTHASGVKWGQGTDPAWGHPNTFANIPPPEVVMRLYLSVYIVPRIKGAGPKLEWESDTLRPTIGVTGNEL